MIFAHSKRIANLLRDEPGGVWIDRSLNGPNLWLVSKLQMNIVREIDAGAPVALNVWVVDIEGAQIAAFGFTVFDGLSHPKAIYGACRSAEQIEDLRSLLKTTSFQLQVHNENGLPMLHLGCKARDEIPSSIPEALPAGDYPTGDGFKLRQRALDIIAFSMAKDAKPDLRIKVRAEIPLTFEKKVHLKATVIGSGSVTVADTDQGGELERLTFLLLENLFIAGTFHSPQRDHAKGRREVCDILAVSRVRELTEEGVFVIQNKVEDVTGSNRTRTTDRRRLSIQKNILEGIDQTVGAIQKLKKGIQVYRRDGVKIEIDPVEVAASIEPLNLHERANQVGNGIVLISDMHEEVDWELIWVALLEAHQKTQYFFHILDLQELQQFVFNADGRPARFGKFFVARWNSMAKRRNAFARFQFKV